MNKNENQFESDFRVVGSFNNTKFSRFDAQRTINLYEVIDPESEKQRALFPFPGYNLNQNLPSSSNTRASYVDSPSGLLYWISGQNIFTLNSVYIPTKIGTLTTFSGHVGISSNQNQVIFVDGAKGYIYTKSTGIFAPITDPNFPTLPTDVAFLDSYFIVCQANSKQFRISALNDGTMWPALAFASITTQPDIIVGLAVLHRRLFIFGKKITEVWYSNGSLTSAVPLSRDNNLVLPYGCGAIDSIKVDYGKLFFLASQSNGPNQIMMTEGTTPRKITPWFVESALSGYTNAQDGIAVIFKISGMVFYVLSFTKDNQTWVYNVDFDKWSEAEQTPGNRHIIQTHAYYNQQHLIGSYQDGGIYIFSDDIYANNGQPIRRQRITSPFLDQRYRKISIDRIELDCIRGQGTPIGNDVDPQIFLGVSIDGGNTYQVNRPTSVGMQGQYRIRAVYDKLDSAYDFVFKIEFYAAVKFALLGGAIRYTVQNR